MRSARRTTLAVHALAVLALAACRGGADARGDGPSSAGDSGAPRDSGSLASAPRLASDGAITVLTTSPLTAAIGMAADSFALREAIRVRLDTLASFDIDAPPPADGPAADVVALGVATLERRLLERGRATWFVPIARNRVVLAWTDSSRRAADIDSASWRRIVLRRDTRVGRVDPAAAPMGVSTLLAMQLAEQQLADDGLASRLRAASPAARTYPSADSLLAALRAGALDVIWTYESTARAAELRWLNLGAAVDLGDEGATRTYMRAATVVQRPAPGDLAPRPRADSLAPAGDSLVVRGAPLAYALTIPRDVTNLAAAERFVRFLLSPDGQRILRRGTFDLVDPLVVRGTGVPESVALVVDSVVPVVADSARPPASPRP